MPLHSEQPSPAEGFGPPAHRFTIDPATQDLVFQRLNPETGEVVRQFPDQALLRNRVYNQAADGVLSTASVEKSA
jgi:hypothetical protein